jgi:CRISPR/Cas system-associated protein endoribonuclease Cas2
MAVDLGQDPAVERFALRSGATMAELCDDYLADMDAHKLNGKAASTKKADRSRVEKHLKPRLGKLRVAAITQTQIENYERLHTGKRQKTHAASRRDLLIRNQKRTAQR